MDVIFLQVFAEYYWNVLGIVKKRTRDMIRVKKLKLEIRARFDDKLTVDHFSLKGGRGHSKGFWVEERGMSEEKLAVELESKVVGNVSETRLEKLFLIAIIFSSKMNCQLQLLPLLKIFHLPATLF